MTFDPFLQWALQTRGYAVLAGDCLTRLRELPSESVHCCVTSPPYFGLRDYGMEGQLGLEDSPEAYVDALVSVFEEVRRVLREDGTLWLNLGDSYNAYNGNRGKSKELNKNHLEIQPRLPSGSGLLVPVLKNKDLLGIPWMCAFALRTAGWYLRQDIIWHKSNPMPESVTDRCTKAHEYIFMMSKAPRYYFDHEAMKEPAVSTSPAGNKKHKYSDAYNNGESEEHRTKAGLAQPAGVEWKTRNRRDVWTSEPVISDSRKELRSNCEERHRSSIEGGQSLQANPDGTRNRRDVWQISSSPFKEAHFATFPAKLIEPCVLAGCPEQGVVLDPFAGSGTTGMVARRHGRKFIGCELNPEYIEMIHKRIAEGK